MSIDARKDAAPILSADTITISMRECAELLHCKIAYLVQTDRDATITKDEYIDLLRYKVASATSSSVVVSNSPLPDYTVSQAEKTEILKLYGMGYSDEKIADAIGRSPAVVTVFREISGITLRWAQLP